MTTKGRKKRIDAYREKSLLADDLYDSGRSEECLTLLRDCQHMTAEAGDEDYRLYFDAEIINYTKPDYPRQVDLIKKALKWCQQRHYPPDYFLLRTQGVYFGLQDEDKVAIELFDRALAIKPDDISALSSKGTALGRMGDHKAAIELFDRSLAIKPDDPDTLSVKGVSLSYLGNHKAAIEFYDRALAIKPDDIHALRNKGATLGSMGDEKAAIELCDRALAIKPDDVITLRCNGLTLNNLGRQKEAIELYDRALAIKPDDPDTLRGWAIAAFDSGDPETACEKIRQAAKLKPAKYVKDFRSIMRLTGKNPDAEWKALFHGKTKKILKPRDELSDIRDFVGTMRKGLGKKGDEYLNQKRKAENKQAEFLKPESRFAPDRSFFLVLRKWNSYTPAIPSDDAERCRGGGYFIYHKGRGTIIDPGYNFLENFHDAGCRIHDINNIVITHAHNDHTIDFESICTLLYQYNRDVRKTGQPTKKIRLYLNNGAYKKFSGLLNLMDKNFETIQTLNAGNHYEIAKGMNLTALPAYHDEVVARNQSVGLLFTFQFDTGVRRKIVFTGDTGLFPLRSDNDELVPDTTSDELELWKRYPATARNKPDLLVVHIGSIEEKELKVDLNQGIDKWMYANHLGLIGTARMIAKLKPSHTLVSEFGEEMRQFRLELVKSLEEDVVKKAITEKPVPRVVPADLAFIYDIMTGKFLCCEKDAWTDVDKIQSDYGNKKNKEDIYYFDRDAYQRIEKSDYDNIIKRFKRRRKARKGMYFRK